MKNTKLSLKLGFGFGLVLILTGVVAFVGFNGLNTVGGSAQSVEMVNYIEILLLQCRRYEKDFMLRGFTVWQGDTQNAKEKMDAVFGELETLIKQAASQQSDDGVVVDVHVDRVDHAAAAVNLDQVSQ